MAIPLEKWQVFAILICNQVHTMFCLKCTVPKASISCKIWNRANVDCSYREFDCIPSISHQETSEHLDLSYNKLRTLPENGFIRFQKLQTLDLSSNLLSHIHSNAFNGLNILYTLNLSSNYIESFPDYGFRELQRLSTLYIRKNRNGKSPFLIGDHTFCGLTRLQNLDISSYNGMDFAPDSSPFKDLSSLQVLIVNIYKSNFFGVTISRSTFNGLGKLQKLYITAINITYDTPFSQLAELQYLYLHLLMRIDTNLATKFLNGLDKLIHFEISKTNHNPFFNVTLCPLVSLKTLVLATIIPDFNLGSKCIDIIPLEVLHIETFVPVTIPSHMRRLSHLTLFISKYSNGSIIRDLESVHSPLQSLYLQLHNANISNTTFKSLPLWKADLRELAIYAKIYDDVFWLEGSPFQWFKKLEVLRIISGFYSRITVATLSPSVFDGLESLTGLYLTYNIELSPLIFKSIGSLGKYGSLVLLNLTNNRDSESETTYSVDELDEICKIRSLVKIDLSKNNLRMFDLPCDLPKLNIFLLGDQHFPRAYPASINLMCNSVGLNMSVLNLHNVGYVTFFSLYGIVCSRLVSLNLAQNKIIDVDLSSTSRKLVAPTLEKLNLTGTSGQSINFKPVMSINLLRVFNASNLKILDLSSSEISEIDKEIASFLENLTYLDLRNNQLTSVDNLQDLQRIKVLLLGGNKLQTIPNMFMMRRASLISFDLQDNLFKCDCGVEGFRKWIEVDRNVFLWNDKLDGNRYLCSVPYSSQGLSITEINLDCKSYLVLYSSICAAFALVLIVISIVFLVRYRWHIQYWWFLLFNRRVHQNYLIDDDHEANLNDNDEDGLPRYDAYVTYHKDDEDWVDEQLVANLEEGDDPFRLCLRTRDIRAGRMIFNELSLRIQRSRKILVILSPRFVDDNMCYFELNMAHHRVLEENRFVLIFIMLEDIPDNKLILLLRQLFCRVQVIRWAADERGRRLFWQRLREELKRPVPLDRRYYI